jgi:hypothetical protein
MKHVIPHDLELGLSKKAAERAFAAYAAKLAEYDPKVTWTDAMHATISFKVKGISLTGAFTIRQGAIDMDLDVPFLLRPFQGRAVEVIDREVNEWIQRARNGELG